MPIRFRHCILAVTLLMTFFITCNADAAKKPKAKIKETPHYDVVAEYIRSLGSVYQVQKTSLAQQAEENETENTNFTKMGMNHIRNFTKLKFEMNYSINRLKSMNLKPPFETLLPMTIELYQQKNKLYDELLKSSKILVSETPKKGVDYDKMAARAPEITANSEILDETLFKTMPLIFALLIDQKPDKEGHLSRLIITTKQKQELINSIDNAFGDSIIPDKDNKMNWTVGSAYVLKLGLQKDFRCSDEFD